MSAVAARSMVAPRLTEAEWQRQVTDLAELYGWQWAHFRPAQTSRGWRTPVSGPLGAGFPDLVLVRVRDRRLIFAELKRDGGKLSPEQEGVRDVLRSLEYPKWLTMAGPLVQVVLWRPADFDRVQEELR